MKYFKLLHKLIRMTSISEEKNIPQEVIFDLIIVLDESGSMKIMGNEPIDAVNTYINQFKTTSNKKATVTFVTFNNNVKYHMKDLCIEDIVEIPNNIYKPCGETSLHDTVCYTINTALNSSKSNNKIMVIITDGLENNSSKYNKDDVKNMIEMVESKYDWKLVFLGANIDSFEESASLNISRHRTGEFDQQSSGDLIKLCRYSSEATSDFTRCRSDGLNVELTLPTFEVIKKSVQDTYSNCKVIPKPYRLSRQSTHCI